MIKLENITRKDYEKLAIIDSWWAKVEDHKFSERMPFSAYLPTDYGLMVYSHDEPVCAVFMYPIMGSCIAILGFPISNPKACKETRRVCLDMLVAGAENKARELQFEVLFGYASNTVAKTFYERFSFLRGSEGIVNFGKRL